MKEGLGLGNGSEDGGLSTVWDLGLDCERVVNEGEGWKEAKNCFVESDVGLHLFGKIEKMIPMKPLRSISKGLLSAAFLGLATFASAHTLPSVAVETPPTQSVADASNDFGLRLYRNIAGKKPGDNQFISPISIFTALAMTSEGANNESLRAFQAFLGLPAEPVLHEGLRAFSQQLNPKGASYALSIANAIWPSKSHKIQPTFLKTIQDIYGGASMPQSYATDPEAARRTINAWVEQRTNDRIRNLLPAGSITKDVSMVLTNAIYFKGKWKHEFKKENTLAQPFFLAGGGTTDAQLMHQPGADNHLDYADLGDLQAVRVPYQGDALSMVVLLPKLDGMEKLEAGMDAKRWSEVRRAMRAEEVDLWLPRFKMELGGSIIQPLKDIGMSKLGAAIDFSRMFDGGGAMAISDVFHKAFVEVNEEGTEAAAATAVVIKETCAAPVMREPVRFRADRPFLFMIEHNASGSILFMGKVMKPS